MRNDKYNNDDKDITALQKKIQTKGEEQRNVKEKYKIKL